jgi:glycosyltransferase involved in cell wall biosynthesis
MTRLTIVQPYIPAYRVAFFEGLRDELRPDGIELRVAAGSPQGAQETRGDAVMPDWVTTIPTRRAAFGGRSLLLGGARASWKDSDGVILGLLGSSLDSYRAIADRRRGIRVGWWGHVASYVNDAHPLDAALERWLLRRADHVFAYTPSGSAFAERLGVEPDRISTVMNTMATDELVHARQQLDADTVTEFQAEYGVAGSPMLGYIGGLDESKRVSFLAAALDAMWASDSSVRVLIAGKGELTHLLDAASQRGQVIRLGYADSRTKVLIGQSVAGLLNPGRIGLTAVDALVLGRPILTASSRYHAPEAEYLEEGASLVTTTDDPVQYAKAAVLLARSQRAPQAWSYPTLGAMIENFASGVRRMFISE